MKTRLNSPAKRGFTLVELLVAMAITTIIVTVLVSVTSVALDTFNRSRSELRASRQAKTMIDAMARDFESLVTRSGNKNEWLSAVNADPANIGGKLKSTSASKLIFFTAATDRYNGEIGSTKDKGGDVSCVAYELRYSDPINTGATDFDTFVLNRLLVNPDATFANLLGKDKLASAFQPYDANLAQPVNFVCENIYQFTVTFNLQVPIVSGTTTTLTSVPITVGQSVNSGNGVSEFAIAGNQLKINGSVTGYTPQQLEGARVTAITIAATAISDFGIDQLRTRTFTVNQQSEFLAANSYQYSKTVQIPSR